MGNGSPHSFKKRRLNQTTTSNDFTEEQLHSFREQLNALKTIKKTNGEANNISVDDFLENEEEEQIKNKKEKTMICEAITTECEWTHFLDSRYSAVSNLRNESWRPPQIRRFWEQGPIGVVSSWWNDESDRKYVDCQQQQDAVDDNLTNNRRKELSQNEKSKKRQSKVIKSDIMKELKQQKLQKKLRERIEAGKIVKNIDADNNAFESFFDSALEIGKNIRSGKVNKISIKSKEKKKTQIIKSKEKKLKKNIASFENDELFFFDVAIGSEEKNKKSFAKLNDNDLIFTAHNDAEQVLLKNRVKMQHEQMKNVVVEQKQKHKNDGIVSSKILSQTWEDSLNEKKILKRLNVMDFVHNFKDSFFREVEELNLNTIALVNNWKIIQKHRGISRKLRLKLGIIMARERAKQKKEKNKNKNIVSK